MADFTAQMITMLKGLTLYGDDSLTADLWRHILHRVQDNRRLLMRMAEDDARGRPALGMFNQLVVTTRDAAGARIDLKRNGLRLIADATRTLSLNTAVYGRLGHYTLEEVAQDCRATIYDRHMAYGDAMATAAIFQVLAPRLSRADQPVSRLIKCQRAIGQFRQL